MAIALILGGCRSTVFVAMVAFSPFSTRGTPVIAVSGGLRCALAVNDQPLGPAPPPPGRPGPRSTTRHRARPGPSPQQFDAMKSMPVMRTRSYSGSNGRSESVSTSDCFGPWLLSNRFGDSEGTGTAGGVAAHNLTP